MDLIIKVSKVSEGYLMSFRVANSDEKFNPEEQKKDIAVFEVIKQCLSNLPKGINVSVF